MDALDRAIIDTSRDGIERVVVVQLHPNAPMRPWCMSGLSVNILFEDTNNETRATVRRKE